MRIRGSKFAFPACVVGPVGVSTVRAWEKAISGNLTGQHYRLLGAARTAHLRLIEECMDALPDPS